MTIPFSERKIRASLPFVRLMQNVIPLPAAEWLIQQGAAGVRLGAKVSREAVDADGVPCEWLIPQNGTTDQVMMYLHGGGFVYGLTPPHLQMGAYLAKKAGMSVLMVDYRTAPTHPFPAALDDCVTAYLWLLKQGFHAENMVIAGDSAGGNLTITTMMKLRDSGYPLPASGACLSPVTDLTPEAKRRQNFKDPLLSSRSVKFYNQSYLGSTDPYNALISPVHGNLSGLPPILVHAGENEILREDAIHFASVAKTAGVDVQLEIYPRMWHVWQLFLSLPQAIQSLDEIANFLITKMRLEASSAT